MAKHNITFAIAKAVGESSYSSEVRHLALRMAVLADVRTGVGWHSQATIGQQMGVSERHVRRLEKQLEREGGPVRVVRKRRGPRQSEWRIELVRQDAQVRSTPDTGVLSRPDAGVRSSAPTSDSRPDMGGSMTGQKGALDRTPLSDDLLRSAFDLPNVAPDVATPSSVTHQKRHRKKVSSKPKAKPSHSGEAHQAVVAHYVSTFEAKRGDKPVFGGREGKDVSTLLTKRGGDVERAKADIDRAFADQWWASRVTIRHIANNPDQFSKPSFGRGHRGPKQPNSGYVIPVAGEGEF